MVDTAQGIRLYFLSLALMASPLVAFSQLSVNLKTGNFVAIPPSHDFRQSKSIEYVFFNADHVLSQEERAKLKQNGVEILYALDQNIYWVRVTKAQEENVARRFFDLNSNYKLGIDTDDRTYNGRYRLSIAPGIKKSEIQAWAIQNEISLLDDRAALYGFIDVQIPSASFDVIKNTPWIAFIGAIPQDEEIQYRAQGGERSRGLTSILTRGLNGTGMTVGIGDGGRLGVHDDLKAGVLDLASFAQSNHAMQVSGIITGAGLINPFYGHGYAPKANILVRNFSDILWDAPQYIQDFGMSLTNNSYGTSLSNCVYFGDYDGTSAGLDAMMVSHPGLLHVFAAANSGGMTCSPYPTGYATIAGGYQPAKNVLTVGAINNTDGIAGFSSRGPVEDGRIKPEVVAYGVSRYSTIDNQQYSANSGTSFSSPATTGVATLLYERYRQLHSDSLPDAALIKNTLCNAADELGTIGPDFLYGFGRINGTRAAEILETGNYASMHVDHLDQVTKYITIPSGVAAADVMILWNDEASAPYETVTLVNDLDMIIISPSGDTIRPWILNYTPSGVTLAATTGSDHANNYEQITLSSPVSGVYTVVIKGHSVPLGPQKAWLSWDIQSAGVSVQFPIGGEILKPGNVNVAEDQQYIRWDAYGTGSSLFTAEYSTNGGSSWTTITTNIPAGRRYLGWFPPNIPTDQLKVKITASNGMKDSSDYNAVIMSPPGSLTASSPCNGNVQLNWNSVTGADYFQVYRINNELLSALDTTSNTSILLSGFPFDSSAWFCVSGVFPSGIAGLRNRAVMITPNGGNNCPWNQDLRLDSLKGMGSGRILTSSALSDTQSVTVRITNAGQMSASGFTLSYRLNDDAVVTENFPGTINPGLSQDFTFMNLADLSSPGTYEFKAWLTFMPDEFPLNDTTKFRVRQLPNPNITLPWNEDFEGSIDTGLISSIVGMPELEAWNVSLQANSRLRTFAGKPFCHEGNRALTIDAIRSGSTKNADLLLTLNMSDYSAAIDDIRLSLYVMHHEIVPDINNTEAIWIRGSDTSDFVLLISISNDAIFRGIWQYLSGLEISSPLINAGQDFSSSFQIKFSHGVFATAGQLNSEDGQTIDDLSLHKVQRDIRVSEILHPEAISCGLGMESIELKIENTSSLSVSNTTVFYQGNGGIIHSMYIGTVPAFTDTIIILSSPFDFSATGTYLLKAWVFSSEDDFHFNDTLQKEILHSPLVDVFPYLEGFENGNGGWVSGGINNTWVHGVPGKQLISRAAEGRYVWTTSLNGTHDADEISYLYSPCFDLHGLTQPYLSFGFQYQLEVNYDYAWVEYRLQGSNAWVKLGTQGSGVNWYNTALHRWNGNQLQWVTTGNAIPFTDTIIQFRWVMESDVGVELEGIAVDQVHVYDRKPLYTGSNMQWTQPIAGNEWVHFDHGGQRVFSIHPEGQDLGDVTLNIYKSGNNFHVTDSMYLLSRNWVLTSTISPSEEIKLSSYFTKEEATNLVNATGCSQCTKARDGFDLAALRYTGSNEDGNFSNNIPTQIFSYHLDSTTIVPFDNGFYAEWRTSGLSEWWITTTVTKWAGEIQRRISSSNDDAEEHQDNGSVNPIRSEIAMTTYDGSQNVAWRFNNITIPDGSYITSARLQWTAADTSSSATQWILQSEISADAAPFISSKYNISLRPKSTQVVQWAPASWSDTDSAYASPELRHLVQQVMDQPTWQNGNDIVFLMKGTGLREAWSFDGDPLKGALLQIAYDSICSASGICFVDTNAAGLQDGSSWANAYRSLEQALDHAAHCPDITQIWVSGGRYSPYKDAGRNSGYKIPSGVSLYGGFEGVETDISERTYDAFPTILSGDIGVYGNVNDNVYQVLTIQTGLEGVLLDGFTIRDGMNLDLPPELRKGSAIFNSGNLTTYRVIIEDCSPPSLYNAPGAQLTAINTLEVRE